MVYLKLGSIQNQCVEHVLAMSFGVQPNARFTKRELGSVWSIPGYKISYYLIMQF